MDPIKRYFKEEEGRAYRLAKHLHITPQSVYKWKKVPAERVIQVEQFTGIPRTTLRPDVYPDG
jgi:DNA-binding transcriptional regulator YdaS (Cro superfamily)